MFLAVLQDWSKASEAKGVPVPEIISSLLRPRSRTAVLPTSETSTASTSGALVQTSPQSSPTSVPSQSSSSKQPPPPSLSNNPPSLSLGSQSSSSSQSATSPSTMSLFSGLQEPFSVQLQRAPRPSLAPRGPTLSIQDLLAMNSTPPPRFSKIPPSGAQQVTAVIPLCTNTH